MSHIHLAVPVAILITVADKMEQKIKVILTI